MLEMHGLEANGACNGQDAFDKVKAQINCCPIRAIFMDVNMPIMNGLESTRLILELYKKNP